MVQITGTCPHQGNWGDLLVQELKVATLRKISKLQRNTEKFRNLSDKFNKGMEIIKSSQNLGSTNYVNVLKLFWIESTADLYKQKKELVSWKIGSNRIQIGTEEKENKGVKRNDDNIGGTWGRLSRVNLIVIGFQEGLENNQKLEILFKEIIAEYFSVLEDMKVQVQED